LRIWWRGIPALAHTKLSHLLHSLSFPELTDVPQALRTFESTLELTAGTVLKLYIPLRIDKEESGLSPLKRQTEIRCQCEPAELSSSSGYNALSYVWGDAAITQPITLNGFPVRVTTNLWHASVRLRARPGTSHLLIDALCLDQSSTEGKSNQIPLIGKIYSQAEKVLIWIDEEEEESGAEWP
jgi:hypothetical protein